MEEKIKRLKEEQERQILAVYDSIEAFVEAEVEKGINKCRELTPLLIDGEDVNAMKKNYVDLFVENCLNEDMILENEEYIMDNTCIEQHQKIIDIFCVGTIYLSMVNSFFKMIGKGDIEKGEKNFFDKVLCHKKNFEYLYENVQSFKSFVDSLDEDTKKFFEKNRNENKRKFTLSKGSLDLDILTSEPFQEFYFVLHCTAYFTLYTKKID